MKLDKLPLSELYGKEKITTAVEMAIISKEDFTKIAPSYCENVCKLKCKNPQDVVLEKTYCDILIIQDHTALDGKFDKYPGQQEDRHRRILEEIIREAGFGKLTYKLVNLLKCPLTQKDISRDGRAPTSTIIQKCRPYVLEEIRQINPKVIISLATSVTKILGYPKHSNTNNRGEILDNRVVITLPIKALTMIRQNASGAMWSADYYNVIVRDFKKAVAIASGRLTVPSLTEGIENQKQNIEVARSIEDVTRLINKITELAAVHKRIISLDTETTSLDPFIPTAKLLTIQFGYRDLDGVIKAFVIPLWHRKNTFYKADDAWEIVVPVLINPDIPKVLHNGKFDYLYIFHTKGVKLQGYELDTMLLMHDLDSGIQGCYSLKTAIWDFAPELGIGGYETLLPKLGSGIGMEELEEAGEEIL